jgi:hypothetical protein
VVSATSVLDYPSRTAYFPSSGAQRSAEEVSVFPQKSIFCGTFGFPMAAPWHQGWEKQERVGKANGETQNEYCCAIPENLTLTF